MNKLPDNLAIEDSIQANVQFSHFNKNSQFFLDVDLKFPAKGLTAILGDSGSGKTTLLRCIAGLEKANNAVILFKGRVWQQGKSFRSVHKRPLSYVFQESSLFAHLSVKENIAFAIKRSKKSLKETEYRQILRLLAIDHLLNSQVQTLSGGERQRVAIARAVLAQPELLIMDEPLASLDENRKQEILNYLEKLKQNFNIPILYVSHSLDEVARLADHVVLLEKGRLIAQGDAVSIFSRLNLPIRFGSGAGAIIEGRVLSVDKQWQLANIDTKGGVLTAPVTKHQLYKVGQIVRLRILAKDVSITLTKSEKSSILNKFAVTVDDIKQSTDVPTSLVRLNLGSSFLLARLTRKSVHDLQLENGSKVWAQIKSIAII